MRRSTKVILLSLGTASLLSGCDGSSEDVEVRQQVYNTRAECVAEWKDESHCRADGNSTTGPRYFWNHSGGYPMVIGNNGVVTPASAVSSLRAPSASMGRASFAARGGFGGTAHASAGG